MNQECPHCGEAQSVRIYDHGGTAACLRCRRRFIVKHSASTRIQRTSASVAKAADDAWDDLIGWTDL